MISYTIGHEDPPGHNAGIDTSRYDDIARQITGRENGAIPPVHIDPAALK
jgi:hypothetical protein